MTVQANQSHFSFDTAAVAPDALQVVDFNGVEEISRTYKFVVRLVSEDGELDLDAIIGKPATLSLRRREGDPLPIHGVVSDFRQGGHVADRYAYEATLVPRLWLLSLSYQCRVFQQMRVDEIVSDVLKQAGLGSRDFRFALKAQLPMREYCVQYRETDLDFIQRLLSTRGSTTSSSSRRAGRRSLSSPTTAPKVPTSTAGGRSSTTPARASWATRMSRPCASSARSARS